MFLITWFHRVFLHIHLKVHPAGVLITALVAVDLLGVVGVILAAPVLATLKLIFEYVLNKMFNRDPWENFDKTLPQPRPSRLATWIFKGWKKIRLKLSNITARKTGEVDDETG